MRVEVDYFKTIPVAGMSEDDQAMVKMWRALIDLMVEDMINPATTKAQHSDKEAAEFWYTRQALWDASTPGFDDVCDLAFLPIDWTHQRIGELLGNQDQD